MDGLSGLDRRDPPALDRPVPAFFDPLTSHRWGGVILAEPTCAYRPAVRAAFLIARAALALIPVGALATVVLIGRLAPT